MLLLLLLLFLVFAGINNSFAQTVEELEVQANQLFEKGQFYDAGLIYQRLLADSRKGRNHDLNFKNIY